MAIEWVVLGASVVKIALRLNGEADLADVIDDVGALRTLRRSSKAQRDLGLQLARSMQDEVVAQLGYDPPDDPEQQAAVGAAADVVAGLADQPEALVSALAHPDQFHQFVLDHGGSATRQNGIAQRAERLYDRILAVSSERIVELAPTSARALSAGMAQTLRLVEDLGAGVDELLDLARQRHTIEERVSSLPLPAYLGAEILEQADRVPKLADFAESLADSSPPERMLLRWLRDPPQWMTVVPGTAWLILGHALASYHEAEAAADAYQAAVNHGIADPDEIDALAALTLHGASDNALPDPVEQRIDALLADNPTVLARLLTAARGHDLDTALRLAFQLPQVTPRQHERRAALMASVLIADQQYPEAEQTLREHLSTAQSATLHLLLARRLREDALRGRTQTRGAALLEALEVALVARDRRRSWRGDSVAPLLEAVESALVLDDTDLVQRLISAGPEGEATEAEAADPRLLAIRALSAASRGDEQQALQLAEDLADFERLRVTAVCVTRNHADNPTAAPVRAAWRATWDAATTDTEMILAARVLLPHGGSAPGIDELRQRQPEAMAEIDEVTEAVLPQPGETPKSRIQRLRRSSSTNLHAAIELGYTLSRDGMTKAAAKAWSDAADRFDDQRWRIQAAAVLLRAGERTACLHTAENALSRSTTGWPGRRRAHELAIDAAAADRDWTTVISHARQLLALHDAPDVRWVLAHALVASDDPTAAWSVIRRGDTVLEPATGPNHRWQTARQLELVSQYGTQDQLLRCASQALRIYLDDEETSAQILAAVLTSDARRHADRTSLSEPEPDSTVTTQFAALIQQFLDRFPDSTHFRSLSLDPDHPELLMGELTAQLAPRAAVLDQIVARIRAGEIPVGTLSTATDRSYAEIQILHSAIDGTYLRRTDPATLDREDADHTTTLTSGQATLIDAAALHTLVGLTDNTRSECLSAPIEVQLTLDSFNDLRRARDQLARPIAGSLSYDAHSGRLLFDESNQEDAAAAAAAAADMVELGRALHHLHGVDDSDLQLRGDVRPWLGLVATCRANSLALWSDDVVLRDVARAEHVPTFGTYTVINALHKDGTLPRPDFEAALFDLTRNRRHDLPIDLERLRLVASIERWQPRAAALVLTRSAPWTTHLSDCLTLLGEACVQRRADPSALAGWAARATQGICARIPDTQVAVTGVSAMLARMLITPGISPAGVLAILTGTRAAGTQTQLEDPWPRTVANLRDAYLDHGGDVTRLVLTTLAVGLEPPDQQVIYRALLDTST